MNGIKPLRSSELPARASTRRAIELAGDELAGDELAILTKDRVRPGGGGNVGQNLAAQAMTDHAQ